MLAAACGTDPVGGDDQGGGGGGGSGSGSGGDLEPPARGFQLKSPDITINPNEEVTYCWYFKTPNTEAFSIKRWQSKMSPGSHHMILYFTNSLSKPEGTVTSSGCGGAAAWIYAAQNSEQDLALPTDDGTGKPLGMDVAAGQAGYLQLHYYNTSEETLTVNATINAEAHEAGVVATKTAAYVTFNPTIDIPAGAAYPAAGTSFEKNCSIPTTSKVWLMSTHAHKRAIHTEVRNGTDMVFSSDNWEHPGAKAWMTSPFYTFSSGKLTYRCDYDNTGGPAVKTGDSAATDEMCMASGYIFPATRATICYNEQVVPL